MSGGVRAFVLASLLWLGGVAHAADPVHGKQLYDTTPGGTSNCATSSCHGPNPDQNRNGVKKGANNPQVIANAIAANTGGMGMFKGDLTDADLADIAAYIGNTAAGSGPSASVSPTSLSFASTTVGATSSASTVTLSNTGTQTLSISGLAVSGDFAISGGSCSSGGSVAAGSACTIAVVFAPTASGSRSGTLSISHNAADSPDTVGLSGTGVAAQTSPTLELSASSLAFGNQDVGSTSATQTVTVSNGGDAALTFSALSLAGTNPGDFSRSGSCSTGSGVSPGGSCTLVFAFKPQAAGARTAIFNIVSNAGSATVTIALSGTGVGVPQAAVSPSSLSFGSVTVGQSSAAKTVTVSNTGSAPLHLSAITTGSLAFGDLGGTCSTSTPVAVGASCTVTLMFTPTDPGAASATLRIEHDAAGSPSSVALSGTGVAATPVASLSPATLTFTAVVGETSAAQTATLANTGTAPLTLSSVALAGAAAGDYRLLATSSCAAGTVVAAGSSCSLIVQFTASAEGSRNARIDVSHDDAANSPSTLTLAGTGSAQPIGQLSVDRSSIDFGTQANGTTSATQTVTVGNGGSAALTLQSVTLTGSQAGDFRIDSESGCRSGLDLAVGASCTVLLRFAPSVESGLRTATLAVDAGTAGQATVSLSGTASAASAPIVSLSPTSLAFGSVAIGTDSDPRTVTLANTGTTALAIAAITTGGAAYTVNSDCPASLAAGSQCVLAVVFSPEVEGSAVDDLIVSSNAASSPDSVALSGSGIVAPTAELAWAGASALVFPATDIGTPSAAQQLVIANVGGGDAVIEQIALSGTAAADFSTTGTGSCSAGSSLAAGTDCTIDLVFAPTAAGERSATLSVASSAGSLPDAGLSGTGVAPALPAIVVSPTTLVLTPDSANQLQPQALAIANEGAGPLSVSAVQTGTTITALDAGDAGGGSCVPPPFVLQPGQSCTLVVAPTVEGAIDDQLTLISNASGGETTVRVKGAPLSNAGAGGCSIGPPGAPLDPVWFAMLLSAALVLAWRRRDP